MKKKFRNGYEVTAQIKEVLPEKYHPLIEIITSNPYRAPELMFPLLNELINKIVPFPPKEEWQWKAVSILMDKSREELDVMINEQEALHKIRVKGDKK